MSNEQMLSQLSRSFPQMARNMLLAPMDQQSQNNAPAKVNSRNCDFFFVCSRNNATQHVQNVDRHQVEHTHQKIIWEGVIDIGITYNNTHPCSFCLCFCNLHQPSFKTYLWRAPRTNPTVESWPRKNKRKPPFLQRDLLLVEHLSLE